MTAPALSCIISNEKKRPRRCGRISLTTSAERGGSNRVPPRPERMHELQSSHGSCATAIVANPAARISIPVTIIGLAPKRSAIAPPKIPSPCWISWRRPRAMPTIRAAQPSWSTKRMEISGKTTKKPSTTSILSMSRKYLPRRLACDTRDISPPGNVKIVTLLFCVVAGRFPTAAATIFFYQSNALIDALYRNSGLAQV